MREYIYHVCIYIYIYMCVCVCVSVCVYIYIERGGVPKRCIHTLNNFKPDVSRYRRCLDQNRHQFEKRQ